MLPLCSKKGNIYYENIYIKNDSLRGNNRSSGKMRLVTKSLLVFIWQCVHDFIAGLQESHVDSRLQNFRCDSLPRLLFASLALPVKYST